MFSLRFLRTPNPLTTRTPSIRKSLLFTLLAALALAVVVLSTSPQVVRSSADPSSQGLQPGALSADEKAGGEQTRAAADEGMLRSSAPKSSQESASGAAKSDRDADGQISLHHRMAPSGVFSSLLLPSLTASKTDTLIDTAPDGVAGQANPNDTLQYTVTISSSGADATGVKFNDTIDPNTTLVPGSVETTAVAVNDNYTASGNIRINIAAPGVLANDADPDGVGPALTVTTSDSTSAQGGNVSVASNGAVTYNPPAGYEGTDTFNYTISDGEGNTDTATVTFTVSGMIWFINNDPSAPGSAPGDGRLTNPYKTLAAFNAANNGAGNNPAANDNIFLYTGSADYIGPVTLLGGQKFLGQGSTASLSTMTGVNPPAGSDPLPATGGANPNITSASNGINLASGNLIRGLNVGNTTGAGISGTGFGTLTVREVAITGTGQALSLTNGMLDADFISLASTSTTGGAAGISLTSVDGGLKSTTTTIQNSTDGGITVTSLGSASLTGLEFGNTTVSASTGTGVRLDNNSGKVSFGSLNITPTANQRGLHATNNSGSITTTGGAISTSGAAAVEITKTTGLTPLSVSLGSVSTTGGPNGIVLNNTSGSFAVTGSAGTCTEAVPGCSGGRITTTVGADAAVAGSGVHLTNAQGVSLAYMRIDNHPNFGIRGTNVNGFVLDNSLIDGVNGTSNALDEASISFTGLLGTATISNSTIRGGFEDNIKIVNSSGTLSSLTISNSTIKNNAAATGNNGLLMTANTTAVVSQVLVQNSTFSGIRATGIQADAANSATIGNFTVTGSTFTGNNIGMNFNQSQGGNTTLNVLNNVLNNHASQVINMTSATTSTAAGSLTAKIQGNTIGTTGVFDSGSALGTGIRVNIAGACHGNVRIDQNTINEVPNSRGIDATGRLGTGGAHFTITNNTVNAPTGTLQSACTGVPGQFCPLAAIYVESNSGNTVCAKVSGNTAYDPSNTTLFPFSSGAEGAYRLRRGTTSPGSTFNLEGNGALTPNQNVAANNTVTNPGSTPINADATITVVAPGTCQTVAMLAPVNKQEFFAQTNSIFQRVFDRLVSFVQTTSSTELASDQGTLLTARDYDQQIGHHARLRGIASDRKADFKATASGISLSASQPEQTAQLKSAAMAQPVTAALAGETISLGGPSGFTLPAGKSITIKFKATINDPFPVGVTQVSNQGTVSGSNFGNVLTDDPDAGGTADPTVTPVVIPNNPPDAVDDSATVAEDSGANAIDVLANDSTAPDTGETLTITAVTQGTNGSVAITGGGTGLTYTPNANYFGPDSFTYTVNDGRGLTDTATVTVTVTEVNDPPVAVDDTLSSVAEDSGTRTIPFASLLGNDSKGPANESGQTLTITAVGNATGGTVSISGTDVLFTPTANYNGPASFDYTVEDNGTTNGSADPKTDTGSVSFNITAVNDPPDAVDDSATVAEDSGANAIDVLANDSTAPDAGETLTITAKTNGAHGTVAITGGGTGVSYTPNANYFGPDSFTYTVSDGNGGTDTATVSITVTNVNDPPDAVNDSATVAEDSGANAIDVLANDSTAPDTGETLTITATTNGAHGTVAITGGGTGLTYTPNANYFGPDSFTYTVSDGNGGSDTATVSITVNNVNDPPDAVDDSATVAEDSGANAINVLANDSFAPDTGETLTITAKTDGAHGTVAITGGGTGVTYTPNANYFGPDSFTYTISDGNGGSDTATVSVTVTNVNDAPTANDDAATVNEDSGANAIDVLANDSIAPDAGETLTITATTNGAHGTVAITGGGTGVSYTPNANYFGSDSFTYTISDGNGGSDTATVSITVNNVNDPPDAVDDAATLPEDNGATAINVLANDTFVPDAGETLTISAVTQGTNGSVAITGGGTGLTYTPNANYFGPDSFTYTISDGNGGSDTATVSITVTPVNDAPVANAGPDQTVGCTAGVVTLDGRASSDVDDPSSTLVFVWKEGSTIIATGPNPTVVLPVGVHTITLTVTDPHGASSQDTVVITVADDSLPIITLTGQAISLWPPNHQYVTINMTDLVASASDACDPSVDRNDVVIAQVTSDETENGNGDGNTLKDIVIANDCKSVQLRSERNGSGNGRVYSITFLVKDTAGNQTTATATVTVPKSQNGASAVNDGPHYTVTGNCP